MPPLMPGTHTTVTVIPDTMVPTADTTGLDMDGVDTMVDITGTPDTDTDTGSVMLKLKPTLPSSTPASTAMDLPTDTTDTDTDILMDTMAADGEDTMAIMDGENKPH